LARFFWFGSVFSGLAWFFFQFSLVFSFSSFFSAWLSFFPVWLVFFSLGSVRFFLFQAYKTETKPVGFLKILIGLIGFFSRFGFFGYFFSGFLNLIGFLIF
jgi:hypothetical protein